MVDRLIIVRLENFPVKKRQETNKSDFKNNLRTVCVKPLINILSFSQIFPTNLFIVEWLNEFHSVIFSFFFLFFFVVFFFAENIVLACHVTAAMFLTTD